MVFGSDKMKTTITYHIWSRSTPWADRFDALQKLVLQRGFTPEGDSHLLTLTESRFKSDRVDSLAEFISLLRRCPAFESFSALMTFAPVQEEDAASLSIHMVLGYGSLSIEVDHPTPDIVQVIHSEIRETLGLRNPTIKPPERPLYLQPTVFVGRHFDAESDAAFTTLSEFLTLLGIEVLQGLEYSSRAIPDKVKERIDRQDIFLALVTGARSHEWLHAESAYAKGRGKHVIVLVQKDATFNPTILGADLEQIRFPKGAIEKTFIPLLHEFRDIRVRGL
jgi:hypothetical protein